MKRLIAVGGLAAMAVAVGATTNAPISEAAATSSVTATPTPAPERTPPPPAGVSLNEALPVFRRKKQGKRGPGRRLKYRRHGGFYR